MNGGAGTVAVDGYRGTGSRLDGPAPSFTTRAGSAAETDADSCYDGHADAYLTEPIDHDAFLALVRGFGTYRIDPGGLPPGGAGR